MAKKVKEKIANTLKWHKRILEKVRKQSLEKEAAPN